MPLLAQRGPTEARWIIPACSPSPYSCLARQRQPLSLDSPDLRSGWLLPNLALCADADSDDDSDCEYGLLVQCYAVWKLRHSINVGRLTPLIIGSAIGVPFGILVLRWVPPPR